MDKFDVVVIGGGITGATAANALSSAGYKTLLLEGKDFGSGTTSRTSRLQYCGLAYLSGFENIKAIASRPIQFLERVQLARRSMVERSTFARASRHRLQDVVFYLPIYDKDIVTPWKMRAGFAALENLDPNGTGIDYRYLDQRAARDVPILNRSTARGELVGAIRYVEYQYDWPERICVDAVLEAENMGAQVLNYSPVRSIVRQRDGWTVTYQEKRGGNLATVEGKAILNAAGPWVDQVARAAALDVPGLNQSEKGTNIALRLPDEFRGMGLQTFARNGAPFYVIPWGSLHYVGPVNKLIEASPDGFIAQEDEIASLLEELRVLFPRIPFERQDVIYSWAGVRPRTKAPSGTGGAGLQLHKPEATGLPGYYVYTGGLLMMKSHMGREIVKGIGEGLRPGGAPQGSPTDLGRSSAGIAAGDSIYSSDGLVVTMAEIQKATQQEHVHSLEDVMLRRTKLGWNATLGDDTVEAVAQAIRDTAGWTQEEMQNQITAYRNMIRTSFKYQA